MVWLAGVAGCLSGVEGRAVLHSTACLPRVKRCWPRYSLKAADVRVGPCRKPVRLEDLKPRGSSCVTWVHSLLALGRLALGDSWTWGVDGG